MSRFGVLHCHDILVSTWSVFVGILGVVGGVVCGHTFCVALEHGPEDCWFTCPTASEPSYGAAVCVCVCSHMCTMICVRLYMLICISERERERERDSSTIEPSDSSWLNK